MHSPRDAVDSTMTLLARARAGDTEALDLLFARHLPTLCRWAAGRLPRWARDLSDTTDLVQEVLLQTFRKLDGFEYRGDGALHAYLRQAVVNRIRDELRRAQRRPAAADLSDEVPDDQASPLEHAIGAETLARYDAALERLASDERELIVSRVELGLSYSDVASATGRPSADAARMAVGRALVRLAEEMCHEPPRLDR